MLTISFAAQKGGIGKTTSAVNLAARFASKGIPVLLVDGDAQGQSSTFLGQQRGPNLSQVLIRHEQTVLYDFRPTREFIIKDVRPNLDLIPGDPTIAQVEGFLNEKKFGRERVMKRRLREVEADYRLCFIDIGPTVNLVSALALYASDGVMIPIAPGPAPRDGVADLLDRLDSMRREVDHAPKLLGYFATMLDTREKISKDLERFMLSLPDDLRAPSIRKDVRVAEAPDEGKTIWEYTPGWEKSRNDAEFRGARDYARLADWLALRIQEVL